MNKGKYIPNYNKALKELEECVDKLNRIEKIIDNTPVDNDFNVWILLRASSYSQIKDIIKGREDLGYNPYQE